MLIIIDPEYCPTCCSSFRKRLMCYGQINTLPARSLCYRASDQTRIAQFPTFMGTSISRMTMRPHDARVAVEFAMHYRIAPSVLEVGIIAPFVGWDGVVKQMLGRKKQQQQAMWRYSLRTVRVLSCHWISGRVVTVMS